MTHLKKTLSLILLIQTNLINLQICYSMVIHLHLTGSRFGSMSCNLSLIFDHPIICETVYCIDQSDISFWHLLGFADTLRFNRLVAYWSVEKYKP